MMNVHLNLNSIIDAIFICDDSLQTYSGFLSKSIHSLTELQEIKLHEIDGACKH